MDQKASRRSTRRLASMIAAALAGGSLPGLSAAPAPLPTPTPVPTLRVALGTEPDTLDPFRLTTVTAMNILDYIVEPLIALDGQGNLVPALARTWQFSPDGLQLTLGLRSGVPFQDGNGMDAAAVAWNLERLEQTNYAEFGAVEGPLAAIQEVAVVDPLTVRVTLREATPTLLAELTTSHTGILSPASIGSNGNQYMNIVHPVGTGPYRFGGHVKGSQITLNRFDSYWGSQPQFQQVEFQFIPDPTVRGQKLLSGQVDLTVLPDPTGALMTALEASDDFVVEVVPSDRVVFVAINTEKPPFTDVRVRQALNHAVDKAALIDEDLGGFAEPMDSPLAASVFGHCPAGNYAYDPALARQLLQEAGVAPGTSIELLAPRGRYLQDEQVAQRIAAYLRAVDFAVTVRVLDWPQYMGYMMNPATRATMQLHLFGWAPSVQDAAWQLPQLLASWERHFTMNTAGYANPQVDQLLAAAERDTDAERRRQAYCEASKIVWAEAPWIFLWVQPFVLAHTAQVTDIAVLPNEKFSTVNARSLQQLELRGDPRREDRGTGAPKVPSPSRRDLE